jgi:hypothetical protein
MTLQILHSARNCGAVRLMLHHVQRLVDHRVRSSHLLARSTQSQARART